MRSRSEVFVWKKGDIVILKPTLWKLFTQTFEGHKGRPGEVGGSLPAGQISTPIQKHFTEFDYNTPLLELSGEAREALNDYTLGNLEQKRFISKLLKEDYFQQSLQDSLREFAPDGYITIYRGGFEQEGKYANGSLDINKAANYASGYTGFATGTIHEYTVPIENVVGIGSTGEQELFFKLNKKVKKTSYENTIVSNSQLGKQLFIQGGTGSGFHGHKGRIGEVGGSRKGGDVTDQDLAEMKRVEDFLNAPVDHRKRVEDIVRKLGFPVERVNSTEDKGYLFTVGDKQFRAGGEYNRNTDEITMYDVDEVSDTQLEGMLAHEIQHSRYRDMRKESQKQFVEVNREVHNKVQKNWPINADGSLKPKFKEKYWAYDIDHTYLTVRGKLVVGSEKFQELVKNDGISAYSKSYWDKALSSNSSFDYDLAIDETLAEVARIEVGHVRPGDTNPAPIWTELYNKVKKGGGVKKNKLFTFEVSHA